ncbi:hypothetical protein FIT78_02605 [Candidatus Methylopumilus universalis]|uniref:hypothetical protein n=1 Tax=Candidatus Methylopumilus universalis TaxID=2588536 RepID=UPI00111E1DF5|nr:hypothetical protein [Candidatus Methylopumilus universalis]QDC97514.1 hypothetical protein FIT78_02605 [Candidatus Methylopumilus universalis]
MNSNTLIGIVIALFAGICFYFNYEAQLHIEMQSKEIEAYKVEIKNLNEKLLVLQDTDNRKKELELLVKDQDVRISQQVQDIENLKLLIIQTSKARKVK